MYAPLPLEDVLHLLSPNIERTFYEVAPDELAPMLHIVRGPNDHQVQILPGDETSEARHRRLYYAGSYYGRQPIVMAILVHEAWRVVVTPGDPLPQVRPSEHPHREEVLIATAMNDAGQQAARTWAILRNKHGGRTLGQPEYEFQAESYLLQSFWRGVHDGRQMN